MPHATYLARRLKEPRVHNTKSNERGKNIGQVAGQMRSFPHKESSLSQAGLEDIGRMEIEELRARW